MANGLITSRNIAQGQGAPLMVLATKLSVTFRALISAGLAWDD